MQRLPPALAISLCLFACGKSAPPTAPSPPATRILVLAGSLGFGDVLVGTAKELNVSISNTGTAPISVTGVTAPEGFVSNWTSGTVAAGGTQSVTLRFTPAVERAYDGKLTVSAEVTSGANSIDVSGRGTRPPRRAVVSDPIGDPDPFSGFALPIRPDLVGATIEISDGMFTITATFARGTFSAQDTFCTVHLDTDEDPATGTPSSVSDSARIGVDYAVFFVNPRGSGRAQISKWVQTSFTTMGTAEVTYPNADQVRVAFPMSLLDYDDGRLAFKMWAGGPTVSGGTAALDFMPNAGTPAGVTR